MAPRRTPRIASFPPSSMAAARSGPHWYTDAAAGRGRIRANAGSDPVLPGVGNDDAGAHSYHDYADRLCSHTYRAATHRSRKAAAGPYWYQLVGCSDGDPHRCAGYATPLWMDDVAHADTRHCGVGAAPSADAVPSRGQPPKTATALWPTLGPHKGSLDGDALWTAWGLLSRHLSAAAFWNVQSWTERWVELCPSWRM